MRDEQPLYRSKDVTTLGVNPASPSSHASYAARFQFGFNLLSDADRAVARAYRALKDDGKGIQRTVYLVGTDGRVLFAQQGMPSSTTILKALG